ncbi:SH3 domain-containing protein [Planktothrix sp. FACHB-1355]|uniref:SH3 domain-containing protein n=1 Tax=Aerosakkonema funiforme FACHB-1375 TaxID=2949571 RepID=A0A926VCA6_9CYAN|nr:MULTISPECIES: SH3 domain-containing protein [Oscillatoriales]MBD2181264.1 SH3 domain-containing protein [Aerosakkonema funiforme FACHB-1375]MBD3561625.1 SH3 domain-containing protein [Planktothrix sp. FACHB-1355]
MSYTATVRTQGDPLNVRSSANGLVVDTIANGTKVSVTGDPVAAGGRNWVQIGTNRWVALEFLVRETSTDNNNDNSHSIKGAKVVATQTNETIAGGLKVYRTQLIDSTGKVVNTVRCVSGRVSKQTPADVAGSQTPIPFGVYTFDRPGAVDKASGEFGGVWSPVTPTFKTNRSGLGVHYDPSAFKNNSQTGTSGCLATPTIEEREVMSNFIRTYKPTHLIIQKG